jgi:hypothetical protein
LPELKAALHAIHHARASAARVAADVAKKQNVTVTKSK